ncbi:MAG TPA: helix-turn-helix domain-containing protein [Dehalococcoidia bacterium]|nr:helix-turn-helix domain-containing protein [Dehalococcoidia bacterium]
MPTFTAREPTLPENERFEHGRWLTLGQACRLLNVDESTLRRWADAGQVRTFRTPGGHRRFAETDVREIVSGRSGRRRVTDVGDIATRRIRRQLNRGQADWYDHVDAAHREKLRPLGRRLMGLVAAYVSKRGRKMSLLEEARETGAEYGMELVASDISLSQAMRGFTFFRRNLDQSAKQALAKTGTPASEAVEVCEQIMALADEVLLGMASAYESAEDDIETPLRGANRHA